MKISIETIKPKVIKEHRDIICRVNIIDSLDFKNAEEFKYIALALINGGIKKILLDLKNLIEIDSMGMGCFIILNKTIQPLNGDIAIVQYNERIYTLFKQTKLTDLFRFYQDIDAGVEYLASI